MGWLDSALDFGGDIVDGATSFFSGGGGSAAANAGEAMAQSQLGNSGGGFFSTAADFAGNAFGWINESPGAANLLGGVAMGVGQYYNAEQDREQRVRENRKDRQLRRDLANQEIQAAQITPGNMGNTGGYVDNVTQGLISNGMLASKQQNG